MDDEVQAALRSFLGERPFAGGGVAPLSRCDGATGVAVRVEDGPFPGPAALLRRSLWRLGADIGEDGLTVALVLDPGLGPETFRWTVGTDRAQVSASSAAGMTYGVTEVRARLAAGPDGRG